MPEIWPGSDADSSSAWPTEFPDDNMDAGWPADFGHSPSDLACTTGFMVRMTRFKRMLEVCVYFRPHSRLD